jgi:hypothetical protein
MSQFSPIAYIDSVPLAGGFSQFSPIAYIDNVELAAPAVSGFSPIAYIDNVELAAPAVSGFSPIAAESAMLQAPAGWQYIIVSGTPWASFARSLLEGATPAAVSGDILAVSTQTTPGNIDITVFPDGTFLLDSADTGTPQTFEYKLWRRSTATWTPVETVYLTSEEEPVLRAWNGTSWETGQLRAWNGTSWETGQLRAWNGTSW